MFLFLFCNAVSYGNISNEMYCSEVLNKMLKKKLLKNHYRRLLLAQFILKMNRSGVSVYTTEEKPSPPVKIVFIILLFLKRAIIVF